LSGIPRRPAKIALSGRSAYWTRAQLLGKSRPPVVRGHAAGSSITR
jgi:hypothetical protein